MTEGQSPQELSLSAMRHAFDQFDTVGLARDAAVAISPGKRPDEVIIGGLRMPPAMRAALGRAITIRCSWGPIPGQRAPATAAALAAEIDRDLALLAHSLPGEARLHPAFGTYLDALAEAVAAMAAAYNKRLQAK